MTGIGHAMVTDLLTAHVDGALPPNDRALVERHLADCATCRADRRELAALAAVVASLPEPQPIPFGAFWARLERRLPRRRSWWPFELGQRRWVLAPALAVAVLVAGMVAAYASESALPDNPLYPVKLLREDVELQLASTPAERNRLIAHFADTRLNEAAGLMREGKDALAIRTVERFQVLVAKLAKPPAPPAGRDPQVESNLESFEVELKGVDEAAAGSPAVLETVEQAREAVERAREAVERDERERRDKEDRERKAPKDSDSLD